MYFKVNYMCKWENKLITQVATAIEAAYGGYRDSQGRVCDAINNVLGIGCFVETPCVSLRESKKERGGRDGGRERREERLREVITITYLLR